MRLYPSRSPNMPFIKCVEKPARYTIPQTEPTCTRLRPKASDICLNKTGMQIPWAATPREPVSAAKMSMYHLLLDCMFFINLVSLLTMVSNPQSWLFHSPSPRIPGLCLLERRGGPAFSGADWNFMIGLNFALFSLPSQSLENFGA